MTEPDRHRREHVALVGCCAELRHFGLDGPRADPDGSDLEASEVASIETKAMPVPFTIKLATGDLAMPTKLAQRIVAGESIEGSLAETV